MLAEFSVDSIFFFFLLFIFNFCIFKLIKNLLEKEYNFMEIMDEAKLFLKSFLNLFGISVIVLRCGSVFRHSSDVLPYCR